jgi:predicted CxxxxCH...CXXCH cytochrome family protein
MVLIPDNSLTYPNSFMYEVTGNTVDTISIEGSMDAAITSGKPYAIIKGKLIRDVIKAPDRGTCTVTGNEYICTNTIPKTVRLFRDTGANSFADGDTAYDGVCEVCHAQTTHHRRDESGGDHTHNAGTDCIGCHAHLEGFKPSCGACHDTPPVTAAGLVENVLGPPGTGSATAGAHDLHVNTKSIDCESCHLNSAGSGPTHDSGLDVTLGFSLFNGDYLGGLYDGQTTVTYDSSEVSTTVSSAGTRTCSNIYCHGSTMAPNGGTDITPVWDDPATAQCNTCHGATASTYPFRASHIKHAREFLAGYNYECGLCHKDPVSDDSLHVNNRSEIIFSSDPKASGGTYSGTDTMLDTYDTCTNVYCHSTVQSSPPGSGPTYKTTPIWGVNDTLGCGACHGYFDGVSPNTLTSGSHSKHFEYYWGWSADCFPCHNWNSSDDQHAACHDAGGFGEAQRDRHADHTIDIVFAPKYGGSYSGSSTPDVGYGDCSNLYCHGNYSGSGINTTPAWGGAGSVPCGTCHGASNSPDSAPDSGSHEKHADSDQTMNTIPQFTRNRNYECTMCHNGILGGSGPSGYTIADKTKHVNTKVDWAFDATDQRLQIGTPSYSIATGTQSPSDGVTPRAYGTCTVYCHSNAQPDLGTGPPDSYATPTWGATVTCGNCHERDSHSAFGGLISSGSHTEHIAYKFTTPGTYKKCDICHKMGSVDIDVDECNSCHNGDEVTTHVDGTIDVLFDSVFVGAAASYDDISGTPGQPGNGYFSCSNAYCHSNGTSVSTGSIPNNTTAAWGAAGPLACDACHGNYPAYTNGSPKANSHMVTEHTAFTCNYCHNTTTSDGVTISSFTAHVDAIYTVDAGGGESFTYAFDAAGGTCSTVSCHTGNATRQWGSQP